MNPPADFFRSITLTDVTLRVRDLERALAFYRDVLGLRAVAAEKTHVALSADGRAPALLMLEHAPEAPPPVPGAAGLYHVALLYPDRAALGRAWRRVAAHDVRLGAADHGVSEALYLHDPEGNGLELYADRPSREWPASAAADGHVTMFTHPLDLRALLAAAGAASRSDDAMPATTRVGHIHLGVSDLARAEKFYAETLGFPVRQRGYPGALFFGRDGYHHHLAVNTWHAHRATTPGASGLARFTIRFADHDAFLHSAHRATGLTCPLGGQLESLRVPDPDGIAIELQPDATARR